MHIDILLVVVWCMYGKRQNQKSSGEVRGGSSSRGPSNSLPTARKDPHYSIGHRPRPSDHPPAVNLGRGCVVGMDPTCSSLCARHGASPCRGEVKGVRGGG